MVGPDGAFPLPWLALPLQEALHRSRGHALMVHGPQGVGQWELSLTLAQAWLCESTEAARPCGRCGSCRLVQAHTHPDLLVLLPEVLREPLGWGTPEGDGTEGGTESTGKTKPSKDIKVDAVRALVAFAQTTASRGRGKVAVLHPAERMNGIAANTLLKSLEEPPGDMRFVLSCAAPQALLPTILSRCQAVRLTLPDEAQAVAWLTAQGVAEPGVMLAASGGQPQLALDFAREGIDATLWQRLPADVVAGRAAAAIADWPLPRLIDTLQKLCHDALCVAAGATPRYFSGTVAGRGASVAALTDWAAALRRTARHAEHPWHAGLMAQAQLAQASRALRPAAPAQPGGQGLSVHSRP
jgi:DNA polymerase-3 subunit delta'